MHKHFPLITVLLLVCTLCLALSGCASSEARPTDEATEEATLWLPGELNQELERLNYDLDYTTAYYDYSNSLYDDYTVEAFHNLSNTQLDSNQQESLAVGWEIFTSKEDLAAFEQTIEAVEAARAEELRRERPNEDSSAYELVSMTRKTKNVEYTDEFFKENALLLIDLCVWQSPRARFYPENLKIDGDTVSLDVRWDSSNAMVGSSSGQYCLIVIPAGCTNAELNLRYEPLDS